MTKGKFISDLRLRLGGNSDDFDIDNRQIALWLDQARALVVKQSMMQNGGELAPSLFVPYECVPVSREKSSCNDCFTYTLGLPATVLDLQDDAGINVFRPGGKSLDRRQSAAMASLIQASGFAEGAYWYRVGQSVRVEGKFPENIKFNVHIIPSDTSSVNDDSNYPIPSDLAMQVLEMAEQIGRRQIGTPLDVANDGADLAKV